MTSRQRMLAALNRQCPDRLPVTTHHVMQSYLRHQLHGATVPEFFDKFGFDAICWVNPYQAAKERGDYLDPNTPNPAETPRILNPNWQITQEIIEDQPYDTVRYTIHTPGGNLQTVLQSNEHTTWIVEHLLKEKADIELLNYATSPVCNVAAVNRAAEELGERGLVRGHIPSFDLYGQPGCWQDACCLYGVEFMIMATFDDPDWIHECLKQLQKRKLNYISTLTGAKYDLLELGGGDASTTIISPSIFREFVAPYDAALVEAAHQVGQRIVYHTCGGMMPILEDIAAMGVDAMETFTPPEMGGDTDLAEAKRRIGSKVCMIGGFNQIRFFKGATEEETRRAVRHCFEQAGPGGGYILSPSDHFFEADSNLLYAFCDEASKCSY